MYSIRSPVCGAARRFTITSRRFASRPFLLFRALDRLQLGLERAHGHPVLRTEFRGVDVLEQHGEGIAEPADLPPVRADFRDDVAFGSGVGARAEIDVEKSELAA